MPRWHLADHVQVYLPNHRTRHWQWCHGVVIAINVPGLHRGVRVRLDEAVNGVDTCYATHDELRAAAVV